MKYLVSLILIFPAVLRAQTTTNRLGGLVAPCLGCSGWGVTLNNDIFQISTNVASQIDPNTFTSSQTILNSEYITGNVGIGTGESAPANKLEVNGAIVSSGTVSQIGVTRRDTNKLAWLQYSAAGEYNLAYNSVLAQNMLTINTGGNVAATYGITAATAVFTSSATAAYGVFTSNVSVAGSILITNSASNLFYGYQSGQSLTSGSQSSGFGSGSLYSITSGVSDTALGNNSLHFMQVGQYNTGVGVSAEQNNTSGNNNTAVGHQSLAYDTLSDNTALGYQAGAWYTGGPVNQNNNSTQSTFLGSQTESKTANDTNETVIGFGAIGAGSNTVTLGNTSVTQTLLQGKVTAGGLAVTYGVGAATGVFTSSVTAGYLLGNAKGVTGLTSANLPASVVYNNIQNTFSADQIINGYLYVGGDLGLPAGINSHLWIYVDTDSVATPPYYNQTQFLLDGSYNNYGIIFNSYIGGSYDTWGFGSIPQGTWIANPGPIPNSGVALTWNGNNQVGVQTLSPGAAFDVNGNAQFGSVAKSTIAANGSIYTASGASVTITGGSFKVATTTFTFSISTNGYVDESGGAVPTFNGCGTSPTLDANSNNMRGGVTMTSGLSSSCSIVFGNPKPTTPHCIISGGGAGTGVFFQQTGNLTGSCTNTSGAVTCGVNTYMTWFCTGDN